MKDYPEAERLLQRSQDRRLWRTGRRSISTSRRSPRRREQWAKAIEHYQAVTDGDRAWLAKLRIGAMYGKEGQRREGQAMARRAQCGHARAEGPGPAGARRNCCARRATTPARIACSMQGLADHPDTPDLIYDLAMVAEKLDKVDEAENRS